MRDQLLYLVKFKTLLKMSLSMHTESMLIHDSTVWCSGLNSSLLDSSTRGSLFKYVRLTKLSQMSTTKMLFSFQ